MGKRKELKKIWFTLKIMVKMGGLTHKERREIRKTQAQIKSKLAIVEKHREEVILDNRKILEFNNSMRDMFEMLWNLVSAYLEPMNHTLSKWGYVKFNILVQYALMGNEVKPDEAVELASADYDNDIASFGPITKQAFFDILLEIIEVWAEDTRPRYHAAFTWALLDSVVNMKVSPPIFRARKDIPCFITMSEGAMLTKYANSIESISRMYFWLDWYAGKGVTPEVEEPMLSSRLSCSDAFWCLWKCQVLARAINRRKMAAFSNTEKDMLHIINVDNNRMDASVVYFCDEQDIGEKETADPLPEHDPDNFKFHQRRALQTQMSLGDEDSHPKPRGFSFSSERLKSEDSNTSSPFLYPKLKDSPLAVSAVMVKARSSMVIATRLLVRAQKARNTVVVRRQESIQEEERLAKDAVDRASEHSMDAANTSKMPVVTWLRSLNKVLTVNRLQRSFLCNDTEALSDDIDESREVSPTASLIDSSSNTDDECDDGEEEMMTGGCSRRGSVKPNSRRGSMKPNSRRGSVQTDSRRGSLLHNRSRIGSPQSNSPGPNSPKDRQIPTALDGKISVGNLMSGLRQSSVESEFRFTTNIHDISVLQSSATNDSSTFSAVDPYSKFIVSMCQEYADMHPYQPENSGTIRPTSSARNRKAPLVRVNSKSAWKYHFDPEFVGKDVPPLQTVQTAHGRATYRPPRVSTRGKPSTAPKSESARLPKKTDVIETTTRPKTAALRLKLDDTKNSDNQRNGPEEIGTNKLSTNQLGAEDASSLAYCSLASDPRESPPVSGTEVLGSKEVFDDEFALTIPVDNMCDGADELHVPPEHMVSPIVKSPDKTIKQHPIDNGKLRAQSASVGSKGTKINSSGSKNKIAPVGNATNAVRHRQKVIASAPPIRSLQSSSKDSLYAMRDMYSPSSSFVMGFGDQRKYILPEDEIKLLPRYMRDTGKIKPRTVVDIRNSFQRERNFFAEER